MDKSEIEAKLNESVCRRFAELSIIDLVCELNSLGIKTSDEVRIAMRHIWSVIE